MTRRQRQLRIPEEPPTKDTKEKLDSDEEVPMLTYGSNTNFATFREKLAIVCIERYGNLGKL